MVSGLGEVARPSTLRFNYQPVARAELDVHQVCVRVNELTIDAFSSTLCLLQVSHFYQGLLAKFLIKYDDAKDVAELVEYGKQHVHINGKLNVRDAHK